MKQKLHMLIAKLISTNANSCQAVVSYHVFILRLVFFRYDAINLNHKEEKELIKQREELLLIKLGLGSKHPRKALHDRKGALRISLIKPTTIAAMMKLKLDARNKRKARNAQEAINYQEFRIVRRQNSKNWRRSRKETSKNAGG